MRFPDDYMGEMTITKALDQEIELLLAGTPIEGGRLSGLVPVVEMIRNGTTSTPPASEIAHFARSAASAVRMTQTQTRAVTALPRQRAAPRLGLTPRLATVALAVLLVSGTAGMAMAADSAVPGDALYGLDRAFEVVGIGSGSAEERLDEAVVMAVQGRSGEALDHALDAVSRETGDSSEAATGALITAAENLVDTQGAAEAANVASIRVTALLTYIAENIGTDEGTEGREFGRGVAQLAQDIGAGDDPTGSPNPAVAPAPGQGQSNNPGAGAGNEGSNEGTGPGNGNSNGNSQGNPPGNSNSQDNADTSGNSQDNANTSGNSQDSGSGNGQGSSPSVESPSVTAPRGGNGPPEDSPSVTAPAKGNKP